MDELLYQLLWSQLQSLGLFRKKQVVLADLREQAKIGPFYDRWLHESTMLLERQKYLHCQDASISDKSVTYTVVDPTLVESVAVWQLWDQHKERWMQNTDLKAQVVLVETMLRTLPAILTGKRRATEIMFPSGSMELIEGIYQHNSVSDYCNEVLATLVVAYLQELLTHEEKARLRLLEIGASTGGTTSKILQILQPYQASIEEYCYSDISISSLR